SGFEDFINDAGWIAVDRNEAPPSITPAVFEKLAAAGKKHSIELKTDWTAEPAAADFRKPRELWVIGLHIKIVLTTEQTRGSFSVVEITAFPGDFVPQHLHKEQDEMFYVLDGTVWFELGGESITATAGTLVHVPKGNVHGFRNIGSRAAKVLNYHTPGG